jgi:DNA-dependent metalloprotease WSS1
LKGPGEEIAKEILVRVAAKVSPIMKKHGMDVMSLEEFEPNREFCGR